MVNFLKKAGNFLKKSADRVSGALTGAVSGLLAGFIPGNYRFLDGSESLIDGFLYVGSLPVYMVSHMVQGAMEGARKGLVAGFKYPKTLNDRYQMEKNNNELSSGLKDYINKHPYPKPMLLSDDEMAQFQKVLSKNAHKMSAEKKFAFATDFDWYQNYLENTHCEVSNKPIKDIQIPIGIKVNKQNYICEAAEFLDVVSNCYNRHIPVSLNQEANPDPKDIINVLDVVNCKPFIPEQLRNFVKNVRELLAAKSTYCEILGKENSSLSKNDRVKTSELKNEKKTGEVAKTAVNTPIPTPLYIAGHPVKGEVEVLDSVRFKK